MNYTFPTDRNGQVYYGPKTLREGNAMVDDRIEDYDHDNPYQMQIRAAAINRIINDVADMMEAAGYVAASKRIRKPAIIKEQP